MQGHAAHPERVLLALGRAGYFRRVRGLFVSKRVGNYQHNPTYGILLAQLWVT
jgi:hypothetical protein